MTASPKGGHTPGPWKVERDGSVTAGQAYVIPSSEVLADFPQSPVSKGDAARIVACVNACEGVPTAELVAVAEGKPEAMGLLASAQHLFKVRQERDSLRSQADALAGALRKALPALKGIHRSAEGWDTTIEQDAAQDALDAYKLAGEPE